jgi:putative transcriptional regulator|tara:strand:- start:7340 stop:7660 length:321 start_codon:yes stop_codon:yes gene_type:complete
MSKREYKSDTFSAIHEMAEGLHEIGVIDKATMREFDKSCLGPIPEYSGERIRLLREREKVSQPVFAAYLAVSKNLVSDWERDEKKPGGPARRLLSLIEHKGLAALS